MAETGSFSTNTRVEFNLKAYYSYTQNTLTNKSEVTVTLKLRHNTISATALSGSYLSVAGNKVTYDGKRISQSSSGVNETTLATKTVTISHNSDGTGSCTIKADFVFNGTYGGKYIGTLSLNKTLTLQTIPRSSTFSVPSIVNTGSSLKIGITPSSSTFKHKVRFEIDGISKYTSDWISAGTTSFSYTIPHSWLPSSVSATMNVYCYTYTSSATSNSDYIARVKKTTTVNVPSSVVPSISSVTPTVVGGLNGKYVQGKSQIKLAVSASGSDSTIKSYIYTGQNINGTNSSYTGTSSTKTSSIIQKSGSFTYTVQVKDSRNRLSAKKTVSVNVEPYSAPQISSIKVERCLSDGTISSSGTYAYVTVRSSYSKVDGANTRTITLTNSSDNYASSTTIQSTSNTDNVYSGVYGSEFALGTEYTIKAKITDTAYSNEHEMSTKLKTVERPLNISPYGNGVAIGGLSTVTSPIASGKFECNWQTLFKEGVHIDNSSDEYFTVTRRSMSKDIDNDNINETVDIRGQLYVNSDGYVSCRRGYKLSDATDFKTQGYWYLRESDMYISYNTITNGEFLTNGKTSAYDGNQGACVSNNGRVYVVGDSDDSATGTPGLVFAFNKSTSNTSSILETSSGQITVKGTLNATVKTPSDERMKKDFNGLDRFEKFYHDLNPCCFKMKSNDERYHIGFVAQQVEQSLNNNGLTKDDFGALNISPYEGDMDELSDDCVGTYKDTGVKQGEDSYGLVYSEFIALNTHMIQKLQNTVQEQQKEIEALKAEINDMKTNN